MKKIFSTLLILAVMLTSTVAMAAFKETITPGVDITTIKRLAIALPDHYKVEATEPTRDELTQIIFDASKISRGYVISYDEIAANILRDTGVDIKFLPEKERKKAYLENISKYADAFLVVTTANGKPTVQFFFEVYDAKTGNLDYVLTTMNKSIGKNPADYQKACEDFYKKFDSAIEALIKKAQKKK